MIMRFQKNIICHASAGYTEADRFTDEVKDFAGQFVKDADKGNY